LPRLCQLGKYLLVLRVFYNGPRRDLQYDVLSIGSVGQIAPAGLTMFCPDVFSVFEVDQCPELRIYLKDYMTSPASVSSVGSALWNIFCPQQMY